MRKYAAITSALQEHQLTAKDKAVAKNMILAHGTGSGKTLTAIAAADEIGKPAVAFTPASLVENFNKEIAKHRSGGSKITPISLSTAAGRNYQIPEGSTLLIDEAHALRNADTMRSAYVRNQAKRAGRIIALTGTPAYNNITDWAPLVNLMAGKELVPNDPAQFKKRYIAQRRVRPSFLARTFLGAKDGIVEELQNADQLHNALSPYVDVFYKDVEKPERIDEDIDVPLSPEQEDLYGYLEGQLPSVIKYKLTRNLPPSKREAVQLNAFLTGVRQASNTIQGFDNRELSLKELRSGSSKISRAVDNLRDMYKKDPRFRALVYSNYIGSGIDPYAKMLDDYEIPYRRFTGSLSKGEKKRIVDAYNKGQVPVILGSGSASEGLDLQGTKLIQILEPHFNNARLDQVIGRGIRYKSHAHLPPEERKVRVQRYHSTFGKPKGLFSFLSSPRTSVDTYLKTRAAEKQQMIDAVKAAITPNDR